MSAQIIECPQCEWEPDGEPHWTCSCGHAWNTFDTRGKCPACGTQWENTSCPGCKKKSNHADWYRSRHRREELSSLTPEEALLKRRKYQVEEVLQKYGIRNRRISFLPYLELPTNPFQPVEEVGKRILILWAVAYLAQQYKEKNEVEEWLRSTNLWESVSENERLLFKKKQSQRVMNRLSWRVEGMLALCWCVNLIDELPRLDREVPEDKWEQLMEKLPSLSDPEHFLASLSYRAKEEIFFENIVNEMVTGYLRDLALGYQTSDSTANPDTSFERLQALNWVRCFGGITEWDETDTST